MKAIYQKPVTILVTIATQQMIAFSQTPEKGFDKTSAPTLDENVTGGSLSRNFSIWGDEEEEQ